jgi:hypothetical protein
MGIDRLRQRRLNEFLDSPIDSRDPSQYLHSHDLVDVPEPAVPRARPPNRVISEWDSRLSRLRHRAQLLSAARPTPANSYSSPSLMQRQMQRASDPLHQAKVEDVARRQTEVIQGPAVRIIHPPAWRCLPRGILETSGKRSMSRFRFPFCVS